MSHEYLGRASLTRHAETFKEAILVQASAFVEARIAVTLIDVVLTPDNHSEYDCITQCGYSKAPGSRVSSLAVTSKRAWCVDTFAPVLAGRPPSPALIDVLIACGPGVA